jgi:hypothetical protein
VAIVAGRCGPSASSTKAIRLTGRTSAAVLVLGRPIIYSPMAVAGASSGLYEAMQAQLAPRNGLTAPRPGWAPFAPAVKPFAAAHRGRALGYARGRAPKAVNIRSTFPVHVWPIVNRSLTRSAPMMANRKPVIDRSLPLPDADGARICDPSITVHSARKRKPTWRFSSRALMCSSATNVCRCVRQSSPNGQGRQR